MFIVHILLLCIMNCCLCQIKTLKCFIIPSILSRNSNELNDKIAFSSLHYMYGNIFYFLQFQLNIHRFKCIARFGLAHIVATNLCVWIRTVVKECTKEIALYRVNRGHGVSEDYMILGMYKYLVRASSVLFCPKLLNLILY